MKLTQNQIDSLTSGKKHWSEKQKHILDSFKSWFGFPLDPEKVEWLMEVFVPKEQKRLNQERYQRNKSESKGYTKVLEPKIGELYHLSWALNGCVWRLTKLLPYGKCQMITPMTGKVLIADCKDLLHTRRAEAKQNHERVNF